MTTESPYLSVVVASRNDTHGGDPLARLQALVTSFGAQCDRFALDAELVVVEWNPPMDRPRLRDVVRIPDPGHLAVRFIEVPSDLHATLPSGDVLPLFQMMAKNVGIRRARGAFVLSTNIDIIFSNELVEFIAARRLERSRLYRVDRHDIESGFPVDAALDAQMAYCATHQLRVHARAGTYVVDSCGRQRSPEHDDIVAAPEVTLGEGWHVREGDAQRGFFRWAAAGEAYLIVDRSRADVQSGAVLELDLAANPYDPDGWVDLEIAEKGAALGRRRIASHVHATTRIVVALADGAARHRIALRLRGASPSERRHQPLFERREGLAYRLYGARLRVLPWTSALACQYETAGPLQPQRTGTYSFAFRSDPTQPAARLDVLDDRSGEALLAEHHEVYDRGTRVLLATAKLPANAPVWLRVTQDSRGSFSGSAPYEELRPSVGPASLARSATVLSRRAVRAIRRTERRARTAIAPALRAWVHRFDPSPAAEQPVAADDVSGTTAELTAIRDFVRANPLPRLHQNACGDFQLMAREHWIDLRGFAEFATYSMSLDGLLSAAAAHAGVREHALDMPMCIYHLEHEKGSGWTPEGEALLRQRIAERGVTWVEERMVHLWTASMAWVKRPMIFNGESWGFGGVALPESTPQPMGKRS